MMSYRRGERAIAVCLTVLSGYVDAIGFIYLGGYFLAFMSGNSTRLGVGFGQGWMHAALPAGLISLFVAGVVIGTLTGRRRGPHRRVYVLALVFLLLAGAALCHRFSADHLTIALMVLAMGAENTVFERNGEVSIGLTYMTGTLVKLGQRLTLAFLGGDRFGWVWHLLLWLGLISGTLIGAIAYERFGLDALWAPVAAALAITLTMTRLPEPIPVPPDCVPRGDRTGRPKG